MPTLPFAEYRPDVSDINSKFSQSILNALPRGDGYGPFKDLSAYSAALPAQCRGGYYALKEDGTVAVFGATATNLYLLNNTTLVWDNVSQGGGPYTDLDSSDNWGIRQFGNYVLAVQANEPPQYFNLGSSTLFEDLADLGDTPPTARYIDIVGRFVVLAGLVDDPYRIQWSALGDVTGWTAGVDSSDYQDFADGGIVRGVAGGETGVVLQDRTIRRMTYAPGSPVIFQIERIADDNGLYAAGSLIRASQHVFFLSPQGFQKLSPGEFPNPIGKERVDRTFFEDLDTSNLQLLVGAADPKHTRVFWAYRSVNGIGTVFDKMLCYDYGIDRWSTANVSGEYIMSISQPGITLEGLDVVAPTPLNITGAANNGSGAIRLTLDALFNSDFTIVGQPFITVWGVLGTTEANGAWAFTVIDPTHIDLVGSTFSNAYVSGGHTGGNMDLLTASLDSYPVSSSPEIAGFTAEHELGFFRGSNLEATLETAEQKLGLQRVFIRGVEPITDASGAYCSVSLRENAQDNRTYTTETLVNARGYSPQRGSTRLARGKLRIPAGTEWTFASAMEPDATTQGKR